MKQVSELGKFTGGKRLWPLSPNIDFTLSASFRHVGPVHGDSPSNFRIPEVVLHQEMTGGVGEVGKLQGDGEFWLPSKKEMIGCQQ